MISFEELQALNRAKEAALPPAKPQPVNKTGLDVSQLFLTYMMFVGDVEKTAAALDLDPQLVQRLADEEGWSEKVRRLTILSKGGQPGDYERASNRALNYVQAHQLRAVISGVLGVLTRKTPEGIMDAHLLQVRNTAPGTDESKPRQTERILSGRLFSDLAAAMEKVQFLSYAALGDSLPERKERKSHDGSEVSADGLHAAVIDALNRAAHPGTASPIVAEKVIECARRELGDQVRYETLLGPSSLPDVPSVPVPPVVLPDSGVYPPSE